MGVRSTPVHEPLHASSRHNANAEAAASLCPLVPAPPCQRPHRNSSAHKHPQPAASVASCAKYVEAPPWTVHVRSCVEQRCHLEAVQAIIMYRSAAPQWRAQARHGPGRSGTSTARPRSARGGLARLLRALLATAATTRCRQLHRATLRFGAHYELAYAMQRDCHHARGVLWLADRLAMFLNRGSLRRMHRNQRV
jgi:hypothetical protein